MREFSETAALTILRRAAEVEVDRTGVVDMARLRDIAAQAGISEAALEEAVRDYDETARRANSARRWRRRMLVGLAVGTALFVALIVAIGLAGGIGPVEAFRELFDLR
jgi:hypothetical protein